MVVDAAIDASVPWSRIHYIKASNAQGGDHFSHVAISADGNTFAVGADNEQSAGIGVGADQLDNSAMYAGAVYVFVRSGSSWVQQAYIKPSNMQPQDSFGESLALSADGSTLVVGSTGEDSAAYTSGAVYVFARTGSTWTEQARIKASNAGTSDRFGETVALSASGNTLVVGASFEDSAATTVDGDGTNNAAEQSGAAYVFQRTNNTWSQQAYLKASNSSAAWFFGGSLAISGNGDLVLVGAFGDRSSGTGVDGAQSPLLAGRSGAAYLFQRSGTAWQQATYFKAPTTVAGDELGTSVSLSSDGSTVALGAPSPLGDAPGKVHVYSRTGGTWVHQAALVGSNTEIGDYWATSVALSANGDRLVVGSGAEDSNATGYDGDQSNNSLNGAGAVYLLERSGATWMQMHYLKTPNAGAMDYFAGLGLFGHDLAISGDGNVVIGGAWGESGSGTGVDPPFDELADDSGAVYVFE